MNKRIRTRVAATLVVGLALAGASAAALTGSLPLRLAQGPKVVTIQVTKCSPTTVRGANVIVKDVAKDTTDTAVTDKDGLVKITFASAPKGQILVQVTAAGEKTFGQLYTLDPNGSEIKIMPGQN